jgi:hypothetical protein
MDFEILFYLPYLRLIPVSLSWCRQGPSGNISPIPGRFAVKFARKKDLSAATLFWALSPSHRKCKCCTSSRTQMRSLDYNWRARLTFELCCFADVRNVHSFISFGCILSSKDSL